jgi:glycosyltransferase involved in cell wall biosynthesis
VTPFDELPPLGARTRAIAIVPARDEAAHIERALEALCDQRTRGGRPRDPRDYETIVFANNCRDETAAIVRRFAARRPAQAVHCVEADLGADAHVGVARRLVMQAAARRLIVAGRAEGFVLSTDADTVVAPDWLDATEAEARCDAVMGRVLVAPGDRDAFAPGAAELYVWDLAYRRAVARVEATLDPLSWDPGPRHAMQFAASMAVRAGKYVQAGGLPALPRGEDTALYAALVRIDARVRHSLRVRVATSPRTVGRVEGGFAGFIRLLHDANGPKAWLVEHPAETLHHIRARAALRRVHAGDCDSARRQAATLFMLTRESFAAKYDLDDTFGANLQRFERDAIERGVYAGHRRMPVIPAIAALRAATRAVENGGSLGDAQQSTEQRLLSVPPIHAG